MVIILISQKNYSLHITFPKGDVAKIINYDIFLN